MNPFEYDFGYGWIWKWGHLIPVVVFGGLAALAWKLRWPKWTGAIAAALTLWGVVGLLIVQLAIRINLPLELPTDTFFVEGSGRVLDAGAGSGRSSLMVLQARPESTVVALDIYSGNYGIPDNKPERLFRNAAKAGVEGRLEAEVGDVRKMPFSDDSLDAAVSAYMIDHLPREGVEEALAEIERVLRPNGEFLLMVINPDTWTRVAYPFLAHHSYYGGSTNHEWWGSQLTSAGFEVVEQGTTPGTLYMVARKRSTGALPTTGR